MKTDKLIIIFVLLFISCLKKQEINSNIFDKTVIPSIVKEKNDPNFQLKNGILYFNNQVYSGIVKEFYIDDKLKSSSEYYQGKRNGFFNGWYKNENKRFERFYTNNIKTGTHLGWFDNGVKKFEYQFDVQGRYNGFVKNWYINGLLAKHFIFKKGKENGSQKMWDINGKIKANFYTIKGERHGLIGLKNCVSVVITSTK